MVLALMDETDSPMQNVRVWPARGQLWWWLLGLALLAVLALVLNRYLPWLIFGIFIYYVARPITRRIEGYVPSKTLAAVLTLFLIVVPIVVIIGAILLVALGQLVSAVSALPVERILVRLPVQVADLPNTPADVYDTTVLLIQDPSVQAALGSVGGIIGATGATLFNAFISLLIGFFLLVSDRSIADWFAANVFADDAMALDYLSTTDRGLSSVYFGYTMTIFAVIMFTSIIYTLFNVIAPAGLTIPSIVLFAVVTGLFTLVPLVGRSVVYLAIAATLAVQAAMANPRLLWFPLVFLAVMTIAFDTIVRTYIRPYLSGRLLNTGLVMFAYLFGPPLFGWSGIFLGPFLMVFLVTYIQMILPALMGADGENRDVGPEHTLDEFTEDIGERDGTPPSETDRTDVGTG
jgi:predicted PurR-regulated permease PerM